MSPEEKDAMFMSYLDKLEACYAEGHKSYAMKVKRCPYPRGTPEAQHWQGGWDDAEWEETGTPPAEEGDE